MPPIFNLWGIIKPGKPFLNWWNSEGSDLVYSCDLLFTWQLEPTYPTGHWHCSTLRAVGAGRGVVDSSPPPNQPPNHPSSPLVSTVVVYNCLSVAWSSSTSISLQNIYCRNNSHKRLIIVCHLEFRMNKKKYNHLIISMLYIIPIVWNMSNWYWRWYISSTNNSWWRTIKVNFSLISS